MSMIEAPEKCSDCPLGPNTEDHCYKKQRGFTNTPGPKCPFVLLAAKEAECEKMRALLNEWLDEPAEWADERIGYEVRQIGKELIESTRAALGGEA